MQVKVTGISLSDKMNVLARLIMIVILAALIFRLTLYALPFQFLSPPMFGLGLEMPYRLYKFLHLDEVLVYSPAGSVIFTVILFLFTILCFLFPRKNLFFILFGILFFLYFISYEMFAVHHIHPLSAMVWIAVPFCVHKPEKRWLLWEALRYYACFVYFVSFIYKIIGNSLFVWENGVNSVKANVVQYLYYFPDTFTSHVLSFSIAHPVILNAGHLIVMIAEGLMVIGFFTKKFDRWLLWIPVLVHLSTYLYADVFFLEMLVFVFLFFNDKQIAWIQRTIPALAK